jgi:predicted ATP-grasp superfamily ATP-dependent carboligase
MRVLVLDGNENQAVAAVRGLAAASHSVAVGSDSRWSKAAWSRACTETFTYPPPDRDAAAFVASIAAAAAAAPGTLVLPMTERTTLPLSERRRAIVAAGGRLVLPPHETVLRAFDKEQTTNLARRLGIRVPTTATVASQADAERLAPHLPYPVVVKPRSSQELVAGAVRTTGGPVYARDVGEFRAAWAALARRCSCALVQEFVEGTGTGFFALMRDGEPRVEFAHRRLRDVRPTGSGSAVRESIAPPPRVREAALAILGALKWHGVAMVEFRVQADGTPVFLEVNGRFWNSLALAVHAGVNFPALVAQLAAEGDVEPVKPYRAGVRCRWLLGDVRHLVEVWRGAPAGYPGTFPSRLATLAAVVAPVAGTYHDNFSWRDPMPELGDWLHFLLRKLPRQTTAARAARGWHAARRPSPS